MYLADYHCHSLRSFDSKASLAVQAQAMLDAGIQEMCITDHCDLLDIDGTHDYTYNWPAAIQQYEDTVPRFAGRLPIKLGLEMGMGHISPKDTARLLSQPGLDFVIGSIHNYSLRRGGVDLFSNMPDTPPACAQLLDDYFSSMEELVQADYFDVLGHINYPFRYMRGMAVVETYLERITHILREVVARGKGIEVNTNRGTQIESWIPILERYKQVGGEILTTGSDAHAPEHAGKGIPEVCQLLKSLGFQATCTYEGRKPIFHDL